MSLAKTIATNLASGSIAAGGTGTGSTVDVSTKYGGRLYGAITNGATGPTIAAAAIAEASNDGGTTWYEFARVTAGGANNGVYYFSIPVPLSSKTVRARITGNTAQAVTGVAYVETVDSI